MAEKNDLKKDLLEKEEEEKEDEDEFGEEIEKEQKEKNKNKDDNNIAIESQDNLNNKDKFLIDEGIIKVDILKGMTDPKINEDKQEIEEDKDKNDIIKIEVNSKDNIDEKDELLNKGRIEEIDIKESNSQTPSDNISDKNAQDKLLLVDMGFDRGLVDRIYRTVFPTNIDEALDYVQKDNNDKFIHSYIANNLNLCSICGYSRLSHAGESLLILRERERERQRERERERQRNSNNFSSSISSKKPYNRYSLGRKECGVCSDEISSADLGKVRLPCKHYFCVDCWLEYLKEKINNANVYKISCMEHKCGYILEEKFIKAIIGSDNTLIEKYDKFLSRKKLMDSNKKIKFCPIPDCDGYAEKKKSKYVKCNFGHEFCFDCLQQPHGKKKCAKVIDEGFEEWKSHTLVKRCPYCKFWTEKNEGCNHMTCSQCNFQWCWICEKECVAGHYNFGPCRGLHFESAKSKELARGSLKDYCGLCCIVTWILTNFVYLLIYLFMMPCFYLAVLGIKNLKDSNTAAIVFYSISFLPFFICYEVWSICFIVVASIPAIIIYPYLKFLRYILLGKILGELFPV